MPLCKAIAYHIQSKTNTFTLKNASIKKMWIAGTVQLHMDPLPISLIKINKNKKPEKDYDKFKFPGNPTSQKSDL